MKHDEQREAELQKLCEGVLDVSPVFYDNPNGPYETSCPFCGQDVHDINVSMHQIKHAPDCPYLIAKDLSTNK